MSIPHPKGGNIVWTRVKDHIIEGKQQYEAIGLCGFDYKLFEEEEFGGVIEGFYGYLYLNNLIQLWLCDWVKQMVKMNEVVGMNNHIMMSVGKKCLVSPFRRQEFWKCIGCIILAFTYGNK